MKKIVLAMSTLAALSVAHAGSMGPVSMASYTPYLTGEASYTWAQINNVLLNNLTYSSSTQGWGGRLGGGMAYGYSDKLSFTGEIGGGYYGGKNQSLYNNAGAKFMTNSSSVDGYDILAGAIYKWNYFDIFLQGGFMVENLRFSSNGSTALLSGLVTANEKISGSHTEVFPEIKVGGIYNINPNWGLSVAYMHVFGVTTSFAADATGTSLVSGAAVNVSTNMQAPTLDSVMFGLHYNFVM